MQAEWDLKPELFCRLFENLEDDAVLEFLKHIQEKLRLTCKYMAYLESNNSCTLSLKPAVMSLIGFSRRFFFVPGLGVSAFCQLYY